MPEEKVDQLEEEFCLYQTTKDIKEVEVYWGELGRLEYTASRPFGLLSHFAKSLLCIPHGNADSERMF